MTAPAANGDLRILASPEDKKSGAETVEGEPATDVTIVPFESGATPPADRRSSRSIPPPIPSARPKRPSLPKAVAPELAKPDPRNPIPSQPAIPTVLDRELGRLAELTPAVRAEQMTKEIDLTARGDPSAAATLAYELGELYERRLDDEERALKSYRRAFDLDPALRPNALALRRVLYRRGLWSDLGKLIDVEARQVIDDDVRVELMLERAIVVGHGGADLPARTSLDAALKIAPRDQGVLLELERVVRGDQIDDHDRLVGRQRERVL